MGPTLNNSKAFHIEFESKFDDPESLNNLPGNENEKVEKKFNL